MGDMLFGKGAQQQFGGNIGSMIWGTPARFPTIDPRTGYQRATEARNIQMMDELNRAYSASLADPLYGLPDVPHQRMMEQDVIDTVYNRLGAGGSLGSGTARAAAAKGIADYRLGLLREQAGQRQKLRSDLIGATQGYTGTPFTVGNVPAKEGIIKDVVGSAAKSFI